MSPWTSLEHGPPKDLPFPNVRFKRLVKRHWLTLTFEQTDLPAIYRSSSLQFEFNPFTYRALMEEGVEAAGHLWLSPTSIHIPNITRTVGGLCTEPEHTRINSIAKKFSHLRRPIIENHSADGNKGRRCGKYRFLQNSLAAFRALKETSLYFFPRPVPFISNQQCQ